MIIWYTCTVLGGYENEKRELCAFDGPLHFGIVSPSLMPGDFALNSHWFNVIVILLAVIDVIDVILLPMQISESKLALENCLHSRDQV